MDLSSPLPGSASDILPLPLRVHDPRAEYPPATDSYEIVIGGVPYTVLYWSAEGWALISEAQRPNAHRTAAGGWVVLAGID